ncbi:MAG: hypothetical protein ACSHYB_00100 [Roseibacillus sp.]
MSSQREGRPKALTVVAWLFILGAIWAVIKMLNVLSSGGIHLDFGVLGFFIGPGLLLGSRGWRTCGLVIVWFVMLFTPVFAIIAMFSGGNLEFSYFGRSAGNVPPIFGVLIAGVAFLFYLGIYKVLVRADVREFFELPPRG